MHLTTTRAPIICIAIVTLLPLAAYSSPQFSPKPGPAPPPQTEELAAVTSSAEHNALSRVPAAALAELSAGNTDFAHDLYRAIRKKSGNLCYSPFSISTAVAMIYAGARGETERQIADALRFTLAQDQLHPALNALGLDLDPPSPGAPVPQPGFALSIANSIWGQVDYPFQTAYLDLLGDIYGARMGWLDFADAQQSRLTINNWVSDRTSGHIEHLIAPGILTRDTRLVLANAVYFKAEWETPFLQATREEPFYPGDGKQVTVAMMSRRTMTGYAWGAGYQAVELRYKDERIRMTIVLPAKGTFEEFERSLDSERMAAITERLAREDVELYMPKFNFAAGLDLATTLKEIGMPDAFDSGRADFSGIDGTRKLYLSAAVHKASITVDEMGTIAAAATGLGFGVESMPTEVVVDRPFIFVIRDVESGTTLFVGRVMDPSTG